MPFVSSSDALVTSSLLPQLVRNLPDFLSGVGDLNQSLGSSVVLRQAGPPPSLRSLASLVASCYQVMPGATSSFLLLVFSDALVNIVTRPPYTRPFFYTLPGLDPFSTFSSAHTRRGEVEQHVGSTEGVSSTSQPERGVKHGQTVL